MHMDAYSHRHLGSYDIVFLECSSIMQSISRRIIQLCSFKDDSGSLYTKLQHMTTFISPRTSQKEGQDNLKEVTEKVFNGASFTCGFFRIFLLGFTVAVIEQLRMCFVSSTTTVSMQLGAYSGRALDSHDLVSKQ